MSPPYQSSGMLGGMVKQSAMESPRSLANHRFRANGLILSGVVVATYVPSDDNPPLVAPDGSSMITRQVAVYADVLVYSTRPEMHSTVVPRCLVVGSVALHNGHVWKPRAAKLNIQAGSSSVGAKNVDPRDLDGDHVMVQFIDDNIQKPIITGRLPHPRAAIGNDDLPQAGHRMILSLTDGDPDFWKNQGTFYGIDQDGNFLVDSTRAHGGQYSSSGSEVPAKDASHGNQVFTLPNTAKFTAVGVEDQGPSAPSNEKFRMVLEDGQLTVTFNGAALLLSGKDTDTVLTVGSGAKSAAVAEHLHDLYTSLKTELNKLKDHYEAHTHTITTVDTFTGSGTSTETPPPSSTANFPDWIDAIVSDHVKIPETG